MNPRPPACKWRDPYAQGACVGSSPSLMSIIPPPPASATTAFATGPPEGAGAGIRIMYWAGCMAGMGAPPFGLGMKKGMAANGKPPAPAGPQPDVAAAPAA